MTQLEKLTAYVDLHIESMDSTVEWAKEKMMDETKEFRVDWALSSIQDEKNKSYGAIQFAQIYGELISKKDAEQLRQKIHESYFAARQRVFDEVM